VAGNCRAVCVGHDAGRTAGAKGIQVTVKQVVSITRLGAPVGQPDASLRSRFAASVGMTSALDRIPFAAMGDAIEVTDRDRELQEMS
jgi:hypothetical protein